MSQEKRSAGTLVIGADRTRLARHSLGRCQLSQLGGEGHLAVIVSMPQERLPLATAVSWKGETKLEKREATSSGDLVSG